MIEIFLIENFIQNQKNFIKNEKIWIVFHEKNGKKLKFCEWNNFYSIKNLALQRYGWREIFFQNGFNRIQKSNEHVHFGRFCHRTCPNKQTHQSFIQTFNSTRNRTIPKIPNAIKKTRIDPTIGRWNQSKSLCRSMASNFPDFLYSFFQFS